MKRGASTATGSYVRPWANAEAADSSPAQQRISFRVSFIVFVFKVCSFRTSESCSPSATVEAAVADGLGDVRDPDDGRPLQVGNGACHLQDAVVGTCREIEPFHRLLEQGEALRVGLGILREQRRRHLCVAVDAGVFAVPFLLYLPGAYHPLADVGAALPAPGVAHLFERHRDNLHLDVDAVEQRTGDAVEVACHLSRRADALTRRMVVVAARAGIHRGDKHEAARELHAVAGARDSDFTVLQRLAQHLQHAPAELRQFAI